MAKSTAIIGGGFLGLTLAQRLRQQGDEVTVYESAAEIGGLAATWQIGNVTWDKHYHVILLSDTKVRQLIDDLGIGEQMQWVETKTGFYTDGKLYSMSNSMEFLRFPPLGLIDKFRLGTTIFKASKIKDWNYLEKIPVADWLTKWSGKKTFEKIWLPLLRSKLGESYRQASAAFIWAIIARMYAARRSGLKKEMFGYCRGGYATILEKLGEYLIQRGVEIKLNQRVETVESNDGRAVVVSQGERQVYDRVVVTAAAPVAAKLCPGLSAQEKELLNGVTYQGIVCASVLLKKKLDRFYVTNITDTWVPFTAVIEMTALVDPKELGGNHLVYLPKYVGVDDPHFQLSDAEIRQRFCAALAKIYPHFSLDDVIDFKVSRVKYVFALSTLSYSERMPAIETSLPGVFVVNSAHIANGTLNVNETIALADVALTTINHAKTREVNVAAVC